MKIPWYFKSDVLTAKSQWQYSPVMFIVMWLQLPFFMYVGVIIAEQWLVKPVIGLFIGGLFAMMLRTIYFYHMHGRGVL